MRFDRAARHDGHGDQPPAARRIHLDETSVAIVVFDGVEGSPKVGGQLIGHNVIRRRRGSRGTSSQDAWERERSEP